MKQERRKPDVERQSFTVTEFCARHNMSLPTWRKLQVTGRGPKVIHLGGRLTRITATAEAEWLKTWEVPTPEVQQEVEAHATQARAALMKTPNIAKNRKAKAGG